MEDNRKIDEAIDYVTWLLKDSDPDEMYNFEEYRGKLLSIIGYLTLLKTQ